jgi:hypothetical protein
MSSNPKHSLPLAEICSEVAALLPTSEYLTERHSIYIGEDYFGISVNAKWLLEYDSISVELAFQVTETQEELMTSQIEDEDVRDDIDSAVGELIETLLREKYPEHDWSYPIGEVKINCEKVQL